MLACVRRVQHATERRLGAPCPGRRSDAGATADRHEQDEQRREAPAPAQLRRAQSNTPAFTRAIEPQVGRTCEGHGHETDRDASHTLDTPVSALERGAARGARFGAAITDLAIDPRTKESA